MGNVSNCGSNTVYIANTLFERESVFTLRVWILVFVLEK